MTTPALTRCQCLAVCEGQLQPVATSLQRSKTEGFSPSRTLIEQVNWGPPSYRMMLVLALAALAMHRVMRRLHRTIPPIPAAIRISAAASGRSSIGDHGYRPIAQTVKLLGMVEHWISPLLTYRVGGNPSSALRVRWAQRPPMVALVKVTSS